MGKETFGNILFKKMISFYINLFKRQHKNKIYTINTECVSLQVSNQVLAFSLRRDLLGYVPEGKSKSAPLKGLKLLQNFIIQIYTSTMKRHTSNTEHQWRSICISLDA